MWIRLRLDIGYLDLALALAACVIPRKRSIAVKRARQSWSSQDDFLITLSVRSAFDLMLRALQLPQGSEVLLSALTVPDMVRIVQMHGLIPVPVDTDESGNIDAVSLSRAISPRSQMVVVAHLFGGWTPLNEVLQIARDHQLLVVEDCAQSFCRVGDSGHPTSDVAMFSFGPIKTASALGGAVARVKSSELRERMAELLKRDPIQSHISFMVRLARFAAVKLVSGHRTATLIRYCAERLGGDFDSWANSVVRGFATADLLVQLRRQPSAPLLGLLGRRWRTYDFARIDNRIRMGRYLDSRIGLEHPASHSYWVYPVFVHDPIGVRDRFRAAGFDATCQARMTVVPATDDSRKPTTAIACWKQVVFLPWHADMPHDAVDKMATLIQTARDRSMVPFGGGGTPMAEGLPLFSQAALAVLDRMPFDPTARGRFELMSGGLIWPDEFPPAGSAEWELVRPQWVYRYLVAFRRALTLGEEREAFRPIWKQVVRFAPNWPGLRPERRGEWAARRLRAALRGQDKCLAEFEAHLDADGPDAEPGAAVDGGGR